MASDFLALFVDASHCNKTKAAGWGAWAIRDDWERSDVFGAGIPVAVPDINDAETYGIAMALQTLDKRGDAKGITNFSIQCDNVHALGVLYHGLAHSRVTHHNASKAVITRIDAQSTLQREAVRIVREIVGRRPVFIKHVKGHSSGSGRAWVNSKCDELAGRYMREIRQQRENRIATIG